MLRRILPFCCCALALAALAHRAADAVVAEDASPSYPAAFGPGWTVDAAQAMAAAAQQKKDLLLNFTGSDWCHWCIRLREEVMGLEAFTSQAAEHFLLLGFDFPNDTSSLSAATLRQNEAWRDRIGVPGFPMIYLADSQGRPYAVTGYKEGGPEPYLAHLAELQQIRVARDAAWARAETASGVEQARWLDQGLKAMETDLALRHYPEVAQQIVAIDADNAAGLREPYLRDLRSAGLQRLVERIEATVAEQGIQAGLDELGRVESEYTLIERVDSPLLALQLNLMAASGETEDALAVLATALEAKEISAAQRTQLRVFQTQLLSSVERHVEAASIWSLMARGEKKGSPQRLDYLMQQAIQLVRGGEKESAESVYTQALDEADEDTAERLRQIGGFLFE